MLVPRPTRLIARSGQARTATRAMGLGLGLGLTLGLASCAGGGPAGDSASGATASTLAPSVFEGQAVTIEGAPFDLAELGRRDLVVWFWAPW